MTEVAMLVIGVLGGVGYAWLRSDLASLREQLETERATALKTSVLTVKIAEANSKLLESLHEHQQVIAKLCHKANVPFRGDD